MRNNCGILVKPRGDEDNNIIGERHTGSEQLSCAEESNEKEFKKSC
jgi:hypothetical protein